MQIIPKDKVRKVFKGLDDVDYALLQFFCENGPTTKYEAKKYFDKKAKRKISCATVYRRIQILKEKQFLKIVRQEKFERGSLKADIDILSVETLKSSLAVLGSDVDILKVFEEPPSEDNLIRNCGSISKQLEFYENVLDSLIELNTDLTNMVGSIPDIAELWNRALLLRRPNYIKKMMNNVKVPEDLKKSIDNFLKLTKFLQQDFEKKWDDRKISS